MSANRDVPSVRSSLGGSDAGRTSPHPRADTMPRRRRTKLSTPLVALLASAVLVLSLLGIEPPAGAASHPSRAQATVVQRVHAGHARHADHAKPATLTGARLSHQTKKALKTLAKMTHRVPAKALKPTSRPRLARLLALVRSARRHAAKQTCTSVRAMSTYRKTAGKTKVLGKPKKRAHRTLDRIAGASAQSSTVSLLLLSSRRAKHCGGGHPMSTLTEARASVLESNGDHLTVKVELPEVNLLPETEGKKTYTSMNAPGTVTPGAPGQPGIPEVSELFGVPDNAQVAVKVLGSKSVTLGNVNLYPTQPDAVDDVQPPDFDAPPFTAPFVPPTPIKGTFPAAPADGTSLGTARDTTIGRAGVSTGQYTPKTDSLKIFSEVTLSIQFLGGSHGFAGQICSPWELSAARLVGGLLNSSFIDRFCNIFPWRCGEELMVITSPATLAEATTFANARMLQGFSTRIFQTGIGRGQIGTTAAQIQGAIRSQLNAPLCVKPSYVALMGDDKLVPTFVGSDGIPTDNPYSLKNDSDELPDLAVGRILGNDAAQVGAFVAKINHYESSPPSGPMLNHATIAAQFQDVDDASALDGREARTFIQFAETARTGMLHKFIAVDRIYKDDPTTTPTKFNDGTNLPSSLLKPTFAWDGDAADISAAWNEGRFLIVHRDHGWSDGWGDPGYTTSNVNALTNDNDHLPVLMSINCASAQYDTDDDSFVQTAVDKPVGGAVAAFGDTRNSPSWHNSQIGLGFIDGLLPWTLSGEGPATKQRLGDALVNGKLRLAGLAPPSSDGNTEAELHLWHLFGDPTMQMYGGDRDLFRFDPRQFVAIYKPLINPGDPPYEVNITLPPGLAGQPFSLVRLDGNNNPVEVVGKSVGDGSTKATIPADLETNPDTPAQLGVVVNVDNAAPIVVPVSIPG